MQIVPTWNGSGVARVTRKPGLGDLGHPAPVVVCATKTFHPSAVPASSALLPGSAWSLPNHATATRPGSPTAIQGQMSVRASGSTRTGAAHVRPASVEYEYQTPAARPPSPPSSQAT